MDQIGKTAFLIAQWRAEEGKNPSPLFQDPYSRLFATEESRCAARELDSAMPSIREMACLRTRYFDDCLLQWAEKRFSQVLILGAGFDMRAMRFDDLGLKIFEVDRSEVIRFKEGTLQKHGIADRTIRIGGNYLDKSFFDQLKDSSFEPRAKTLILWEGNTMYLPREELTDFLLRTRSHLNHFQLGFDYISARLLQRTTGHDELTRIADLFAAQGAPFQTGFDHIDPFIIDLGFSLLENFTQYELRCRYAPHSPVEKGVFQEYSVCQIASL